MLILVIIAIILVVSFGLNMYAEENNKEITKEFIRELEKENELLKKQNRYLKNLDLTIRETELLEYIIKFKQTNGFSPTIREMAKGINTKSLNHINNMIYSLQDKGYISLKEKRPRTIVIKKFI